MIETYKIVHEKYDPLTTANLLTKDTNNITRSHNFKLVKSPFNSKQYKFYFSNRIINIWNNLPEHIVNAVSINALKKYFDQHFSGYMYSTRMELYFPNG